MAFQPPKWKHVTLPSVEGVNILKDPPKSITTRRVNKVGQDDTILNLIDSSATGDRVSESIRVYTRGSNPMVEVSYNNYAANAGTGVSSRAHTQAFLPYRIMDGGAFRAPIIAPTSLLPLSRLPRVHTFASANPGLVDFTKLIACGTNSKNNKNTIQGSIAPTVYKKRDAPNYAVPTNYSTKNALHATATSNPRGRTKIVEIDRDMVQLENNRPNAVGYTNLSGMRNAVQANPETTVIKRQLKLQSYEPRPQIQPTSIHGDHVQRTAIGNLKPGNMRTRIK
jgi:hypothetical protein